MPKILYLVKSYSENDHPNDEAKIWEAYKTQKEARARSKQIEDTHSSEDNRVISWWVDIELRTFKNCIE